MAKKIKKAQNGSSLPGMTGFMYSRQGAPSNGKYAKKTLPSAQDGKVLYSTSQPYSDSVEWTRDQYVKKQIPQDLNYVLSHFERNPKVTKVLSGTTTDDYGAKWPGMVISATEGPLQKSKMLNPLGQTAIYDTKGQLPATEKPIKGSTTLLKTYQKGGEVDSVSNDIMLRQLYRESRFKPKVVNEGSGAKGLAQLKPIAVKELKEKHKTNVDPLDPLQSIKGHKKLMTTTYNRPWVDKEDSTEEVRTAKTLAAYNWGPSALVKALNEQKAKGVDIYKSTDWLKALPKETQDYIYDITGKNSKFEKEYSEAIKDFKYKGAYPTKQQGGPIEDDRGQWAHPGKVTKINSNKITMKGVNYPVLGVSDTGHQQMMMPNQEYAFDGTSVTEYPTNQDKGQLKKLEQLTQMAKSGIHIKPENKGKFTATKKATGKSTEELTHSKNPLTRKRAVFAQNAKKWHHGQNGYSEPTAEDYYPQGTGVSDPNGSGITPIDAGGFKGAFNKIGGAQGAIGIGMGLMQGAQMLGQEKKNKKQAKMFADVSGVVKQAATMKPDQVKRKYVRPEDMTFDPNQMSQSYGTGTNFLQLKKGGEIQNTYAPKTLYDDLEEAQFGAQAGSIGSWAGSKLFGGTGEQSGAGQIGSTAGSAIGNFILPGIGGALGGLAGGLIGGAFGAKGQKNIKNWTNEGNSNLAQAAYAQTRNNQYSAFMEDGGNIHPQIIKDFSGHSLKQLLKPDPTMNTLRAGGHLREYTAPNESAYMAMGGALKTHWGGKAETASYNPYLPGDGESVEFKGQSHDDGGIGVTYGKSPVEVEGGEPAVKLQSGGNTDSLVVFGDMKIPSYGASEIGDPKAKGRKFKHYINDLNDLENRQNKIVEKGVDFVNNANTSDPFEKLKMNSGEAMMVGGNMKLKSIADKKQMASIVQNAILETAKEHNLEPAELSEGKIKKSKGMKNAQHGTIFDKILNPNPFEQNSYGLYRDPNPTLQKHSGLDYNPTTNKKPIGSLYSNESQDFDWNVPQFTPQKRSSITETVKKKAIRPINTPTMGSVKAPELTGLSDLAEKQRIVTENPEVVQQAKKSGLGLEDYLNAYLPYLRPSNKQKLDPNQLMGEMYALSNNNLEPVQAQRYNPLLETPSKLSYQDALNANQADFNAIRKTVGNNPEALAALAGQKYGANSQVIAEQERQNQDRYMGAFNRNRGVLNDATLKNLGIMDQQYTRQAQAKSNTKAVAQSALSSISDKIAKNKLENKTLGIYENLYNYRFGPQGRAWNLNAPAQFNTEGNFQPIEDDSQVTETQNTVDRDALYRIKNYRSRITNKKKSSNGSIVKALKG